MNPTVRAKMYVSALSQSAHLTQEEKPVHNKTVYHFNAVYSPDPKSENNRFWTATPSGSMEYWSDNSDQFQAGQKFYLDFTESENGRFVCENFKDYKTSIAFELSWNDSVAEMKEGVQHYTPAPETARIKMSVNNEGVFEFFKDKARYDVVLVPIE